MFAQIVAFVVPLAFDTFAVAIALGLRGVEPWRPAFVFAAFETLMPIAGIIVGRFAGDWFALPAALAGGVVLIGVGILAVREALAPEDEAAQLSFDSFKAAAMAGVGISLDELAVGFPLGTAHLPVGATLAAIGLQAFVVTASGMLLGRCVGETFGRRASLVSGLAAGAGFGAVGAWLIIESLKGR